MPTANLDIRLRIRDDGSAVITQVGNKIERAGEAGQTAGRRMADAWGLANKAVAALGISLGAAAAINLGRRMLENADGIAKAADKVGLTTEALQEMRYAADRAGVQQSTLDMAMQRFSRRVGEAVQGTGELKGVLAQYGIAVTDSEGRTRSLDAILGDLADTVAGAGSEQERLRIAFKAFDSEGAALVNVLKGGRDAMEQVRQEARELGIVLDDELLRDAEAARDEFGRLSSTIETGVTRAFLDMAPALQTAAENLRDFADEVDWENWGRRASSAVELLTGTVRQLSSALDHYQEVVEGQNLMDLVKGLLGDQREEVLPVDLLGNSLANVARDIAQQEQAIASARGEVERYQRALENLGSAGSGFDSFTGGVLGKRQADAGLASAQQQLQQAEERLVSLRAQQEALRIRAETAERPILPGDFVGPPEPFVGPPEPAGLGGVGSIGQVVPFGRDPFDAHVRAWLEDQTAASEAVFPRGDPAEAWGEWVATFRDRAGAGFDPGGDDLFPKGDASEDRDAWIASWEERRDALMPVYEELTDLWLAAEEERQAASIRADQMITESARRSATEREQLLANGLSLTQSITGDMAGLFRQLYEDSGGESKKYWEAYKAMAVSETIVATAVGAMKAYELMGPLGVPFAAAITAIGAAKVALISQQEPAQSFDKGGIFMSPFAGRITAAEPGVGPEVIAPVDKLPELLAKTYARTGSGAGGGRGFIENLTVNVPLNADVSPETAALVEARVGAGVRQAVMIAERRMRRGRY